MHVYESEKGSRWILTSYANVTTYTMDVMNLFLLSKPEYCIKKMHWLGSVCVGSRISTQGLDTH